MSKPYDYIIFICRCQPPHIAHIKTIEQAAERGTNVIVLLGSASQPRTIKNPWTWRERAEMIQACVDDNIKSRLFMYPVRDKLYNDQQWASQVQDAVDSVISLSSLPNDQKPKIAIIGHVKDNSSYYLKMFPQWELIETENIEDIHATDIRTSFFSQEDERDFDNEVGHALPTGIRDYLRAFSFRAEYNHLVEEFKHIQRYKQAWQAAPYPPTFTTTDAVVIQSGHVLLVRRRAHPGKGTFALPGGFVNQNERLEDGMIRELREETKIKIPEPVLRGSIRVRGVYDAPTRSLRGRTITHAFGIDLQFGELPKVKGSDDADKAIWVPLNTFWKMEDQMFEDHYAIVEDIVDKM